MSNNIEIALGLFCFLFLFLFDALLIKCYTYTVLIYTFFHRVFLHLCGKLISKVESTSHQGTSSRTAQKIFSSFKPVVEFLLVLHVSLLSFLQILDSSYLVFDPEIHTFLVWCLVALKVTYQTFQAAEVL